MKWGIVVAGLAGGPHVAMAATPFDGTWTVMQTCPPTGQDVRGFAWRYGAVVRDGLFTGTHSADSPRDGSMQLTGQIRPDGSAALVATGQTGLPEFSVGHVVQGYPIHYTIDARFTATQGTGTRTMQRPCDFQFSRN